MASEQKTAGKPLSGGETSACRYYVHIRVAGESLLFDAACVDHFIRCDDAFLAGVTPIFHAPPFVAGSTVCNDQVYIVVIASLLLGYKETGRRQAGRLLLMRHRDTASDAAALLVEDVAGVYPVALSSIRPFRMATGSTLDEVVTGVVSAEMAGNDCAAETIICIDMDRLLSLMVDNRIRRPMDGFCYWDSSSLAPGG